MKKKFNKYIIYINNDYLRCLFDQMGADTKEEQQKIREDIFRTCTDIIKAEGNAAAIFDSYLGPKGDMLRSVEFVLLPTAQNPNTLSYLNRLKKKRKR